MGGWGGGERRTSILAYKLQDTAPTNQFTIPYFAQRGADRPQILTCTHHIRSSVHLAVGIHTQVYPPNLLLVHKYC